jgi:hypothetical protein
MDIIRPVINPTWGWSQGTLPAPPLLMHCVASVGCCMAYLFPFAAGSMNRPPIRTSYIYPSTYKYLYDIVSIY